MGHRHNSIVFGVTAFGLDQGTHRTICKSLINKRPAIVLQPRQANEHVSGTNLSAIQCQLAPGSPEARNGSQQLADLAGCWRGGSHHRPDSMPASCSPASGSDRGRWLYSRNTPSVMRA